LNQWLKKLPEYDLQMRGLRTLRHLAAHKEVKPVWRGVKIRAEKAVEIRPKYWQVTESTLSHQWLLPELDQTDLQKPKSPQLTPGELPSWNTLVGIGNDGAASIFEHGLRQPQAILLAAERLL
jgi:hypothetical protein